MAETDVLTQLLEFKFRDISVPCSDFSTDVEQDQKVHKWPDRDGGHVEATGRSPLVHHFTLHFRNGISPGLAESWKVNNTVLYPTIMRAFLVAFTTRSTGPLQHPELGLLQCKPKQGSFKWIATKRDGCDCSTSFIESDDTSADFEDVLARPSPIAEGMVAATDLDAQVIQYANPTITSDGEPTSFLDSLTKITTAFDTASLYSAQQAGKIDHVLYRVRALQDRVSSAKDISAWPLMTTGERLKSALFDMKSTLLNVGPSISYFLVPRDLTLAALVGPTKTKIADLLNLNASLAASPVVPQGTIVRFYKTRF